MNTLIEEKTFSIKILIYSHATSLQLGVLLTQQGTVQLIIFTDKKRRQHMRHLFGFALISERIGATDVATRVPSRFYSDLGTTCVSECP